MKLPSVQAISTILDTKYFRISSISEVFCLWQEGISGLQKLKLLGFEEIKKMHLCWTCSHMQEACLHQQV